MPFIKHVGKLGDKKVVIAFRELPDDSKSCLVIFTELLTPEVHDELMKIVEGIGQNEADLFNALSRAPWSNGQMALTFLHERRMLTPAPVADVTVTPNPNSSIGLAELNQQLGKLGANKTTSSDMNVDATPKKQPGVMDNKQIASQMRKQALQFEAEAKKLRAEADELDPSRPGRPRGTATPAEGATAEATPA